MASRRSTVDPAKKKKFLDFILLKPKLRVPDAMKLAMFSDEDIADLGLRRFLQRALPGGTVQAMKAHLAGVPPAPDRDQRHDQRKKRSVDEAVAATSKKAATKPVDDLLFTKMDQLVAGAATEEPTTRGCPPTMATPSQSQAMKRKRQIRNRLYYSQKKARASPPSADLDITPVSYDPRGRGRSNRYGGLGNDGIQCR